ncbi:unnamed protein product [Pedinophyceae sp. YPF-701]|nr:unnamed protein product [Pedinophyceae sp. YPF-701]
MRRFAALALRAAREGQATVEVGQWGALAAREAGMEGLRGVYTTPHVQKKMRVLKDPTQDLLYKRRAVSFFTYEKIIEEYVPAEALVDSLRYTFMNFMDTVSLVLKAWSLGPDVAYNPRSFAAGAASTYRQLLTGLKTGELGAVKWTCGHALADDFKHLLEPKHDQKADRRKPQSGRRAPAPSVQARRGAGVDFLDGPHVEILLRTSKDVPSKEIGMSGQETLVQQVTARVTCRVRVQRSGDEEDRSDVIVFERIVPQKEWRAIAMYGY